MSPSQLARKIVVTDTNSSDVTVTVSSSGSVSLNSATTSPTSSLHVTTEGTYTGVCARTGVSIEGGIVKDQGTCECANVVDSLTTTHITANNQPYTIKADVQEDQTFQLVPLDGDVVTYASTGEIRVGTGG